LATLAAAVVPAAPPRFTMMTGWPIASASLAPNHPCHEVGSTTRGHCDHELNLAGRICWLRMCRIRPDKRSDNK
jgi:hypothetical protein